MFSFRPLLKRQTNGELWNRYPNRLWPDDLWTGFKKVLVSQLQVHSLENLPFAPITFLVGREGIA